MEGRHHGRGRWRYCHTALDILASGSREGYFQVLDARNGMLLWNTNLGGQITSGPIQRRWSMESRTFATTAGHSLVAFALSRLTRASGSASAGELVTLVVTPS